MELEELKKSWNVLDEHLKDKELIKDGLWLHPSKDST